MHKVRLDVVQQPLIVGDDQHAEIGTHLGIHAVGDDAQRVNVQPRIGLVQNGKLRLQQRHLQDFRALLLTPGKAVVEIPAHKGAVHLQELELLREQLAELTRFLLAKSRPHR